MTNQSIQLHGRIFLQTDIKLLSGLHIGGAAGGMEIGGVDKPVIRNVRTNQPYIPGSSLKGKMRSLMEKAYGAPQRFKVNNDVFVHAPESNDEYEKYVAIAGVFGTLPQWGPQGSRKQFVVPTPTRLTVRDVQLTSGSVAELAGLRTDLPFSEIKWEAAIDRVTSAATPRQIERVPAGAVFGPAQLVFSVYTGANETPAEVAGLFMHVLDALALLEDDYLGGMGSRGSGQVRMCNLNLTVKPITNGVYGAEEPLAEAETLDKLDRAALRSKLTERFQQ
jgi:CRISPR-associated protein Csm3